MLLGCPMALVSAADFLSLGRLVIYEELRDDGKIRILGLSAEDKEVPERLLHSVPLSPVARLGEARPKR